jgi:hypothetical protein
MEGLYRNQVGAAERAYIRWLRMTKFTSVSRHHIMARGVEFMRRWYAREPRARSLNGGEATNFHHRIMPFVPGMNTAFISGEPFFVDDRDPERWLVIKRLAKAHTQLNRRRR